MSTFLLGAGLWSLVRGLISNNTGLWSEDRSLKFSIEYCRFVVLKRAMSRTSGVWWWNVWKVSSGIRHPNSVFMVLHVDEESSVNRICG